MKKKTVIIIGGGIAGLTAARILSEYCEVTILESRKQLGGRIRTKSFNGGIIEGGAEFIHGALPFTMDLLKEAGVKYVPVTGKMFRKEKGLWIEQEEIVEGWEDLLKNMKGLKEDMTMEDFLLKYYQADEYAVFRRHIQSYVENFDSADIKTVSVHSLYNEWSNEEETNFRVSEGYGSLISFLRKKCIRNGCAIITGDSVNQIDWLENDVTVYTEKNKKYYGEKIIVTVPVNVLKSRAGKSAINFSPPIDDHIKQFGEIGFGTVIKLILQFREPFWPSDYGFIFSEELMPVWWTQESPLDTHSLTGWVGGAKAANLSENTDRALFEIGIRALANIFDKPVEELHKNLVNSFVLNWGKEEETLGAYSYSTLKSKQAIEFLKKPLNNSLFFAGEGLYYGNNPGTVEAALVSGHEVAAALLAIQ